MKNTKFQSCLYNKMLNGHFLLRVLLNHNEIDKCKEEINTVISNLPKQCIKYTIKEMRHTRCHENMITYIDYTDCLVNKK